MPRPHQVTVQLPLMTGNSVYIQENSCAHKISSSFELVSQTKETGDTAMTEHMDPTDWGLWSALQMYWSEFHNMPTGAPWDYQQDHLPQRSHQSRLRPTTIIILGCFNSNSLFTVLVYSGTATNKAIYQKTIITSLRSITIKSGIKPQTAILCKCTLGWLTWYATTNKLSVETL